MRTRSEASLREKTTLAGIGHLQVMDDGQDGGLGGGSGGWADRSRRRSTRPTERLPEAAEAASFQGRAFLVVFHVVTSFPGENRDQREKEEGEGEIRERFSRKRGVDV